MAANAVYPLNVSFDDKEIARANGARWNASEKKWEFREIKDMTEDKIVESYVSIKETLKEKGRDVSKLDATGQIEAMLKEKAEKEAAEAAAKAAKEAEEKAKAEATKQVSEEIILDNAPEEQETKAAETEPELISIIGDRLNINHDILDNIKSKVLKANENVTTSHKSNAYNLAVLVVENAKTMVELAQNIGEYTVHGIRGIPGVKAISVKKHDMQIRGISVDAYDITLHSEKGSVNTTNFLIDADQASKELSEEDMAALKNAPASIFGYTSLEEAEATSPTLKFIYENGIKKNSFLTSYSAGVTNMVNELRAAYEKSEQEKAESLSEEAEEEAFKG